MKSGFLIIGCVMGLVWLFLAGSVAQAQEFTSAYTSLKPGDCRQIEPARDASGPVMRCPGSDGRDVWIVEGDLRMFVSYWPDPEAKCARSQTLSSFNTVHSVLEWRLRNNRSFATILRYFTDADGVKTQFLVVSKVTDAQACHVAYIDIANTNDANDLARQAADRFAQGFRCSKDRPFVFDGNRRVYTGSPGSGGCDP